jgi:hypothetical protein
LIHVSSPLRTIAALFAFTLLGLGILQARDLPVEGGRGGGSFRAECPGGQYLRGVSVRAGSWIDAIAALCAPVAPNGHLGKWKRGPRHGGTGGSPLLRDAACPPDHYVTGLKFGLTGGDNQYVDWVAVQCLPIGRSGSSFDVCLQTGGGCPHSGSWQSCPNLTGQPEWANGIHGRKGSFVDALGLICATPPTPAPATPSPAPPPAPAPQPQGFVGVWDTTVVPGGERYTIIFSEQGGQIVGALGGVDPKMSGSLQGTLEGNKLGFTFTQPSLGVTGQGNFWLQGDAIDGRMTKNTEPGKPFMWTGTRRK